MFSSNTGFYVKEYMSVEVETSHLMDFTIMARDGLIKTNQVFLFLVVGAQDHPMFEKNFIEVDADVAAVRFILNFLYSNQEISEQFSEVSLFIFKKEIASKPLKKTDPNLDLVQKEKCLSIFPAIFL